ncbi:hypothetical protein [Aminobacter niigataensis]|uniref:Uncharacterized protein n=1 Tax=Aminobacter niigataensis TaxID=83265 RepID=A0ABR6KUW5_9HYPH|nr:hypothetical protein [Aminobacter niigataensis]MBB4648318.1 hypothetical protein [Aminobacter niigataensis]CAI2933571.1 conserved protein of unknown function [Aminobacter niigataensis]
MFANIPHGPDARNEPDSANSLGLSQLAEARRKAWALSIGASPQASGPPRKLHRGMLPDVDMSNVVPDPNHRPFFGRVFALIGRLAGRSGQARPAARTMSGGNR